MKTVFNNGMVAHVWAQGRQTDGRSGNGNFFFSGRTLYSYGRHFVVAYLAPPELAPDDSALSREPLALLNGDRYSISTGRHQSYAAHAVRGRSVTLPGLTSLCRELDSATWGMGRERWPATPADLKAARDRCARAVLAHVRDPDNWPGRDSVALTLQALGGLSEPAALKAATRAETEKDRAALKAATRAAKDKAARAVATARDLSRHDPESIRAEMVRTARAQYFRRERAESEWSERGKAFHRAARTAKAKGWTRMAADLRACHKAIRDGLEMFQTAELLRNRRETWGRGVRETREAIAALEAWAARKPADPMPDTSRFWRFNMSLDSMIGGLVPSDGPAWAERPARIVGVDPAALALSLVSIRDRLERVRETAARAVEREAFRDSLKAARRSRTVLAWAGVKFGADLDPEREIALRAVLTRMEPAALTRAASDFKRAANLLRPFASWGRAFRGVASPALSRPSREMPVAFKVAGWTPDNAESVVETCERGAELARDVATERAAELEKARAAESVAAWRETGRAVYMTPDGERHWSGRLSDPDGGALLRYAGVVRNAAREVTAGTLYTSHGADVPLPDAIRAFRFLKLCRERGAAWRANGRVLTVGHFRVDLVRPDGSFIAGCHKVNWSEVETVARSLGVLDLAPADTAESRVPA